MMKRDGRWYTCGAIIPLGPQHDRLEAEANGAKYDPTLKVEDLPEWADNARYRKDAAPKFTARGVDVLRQSREAASMAENDKTTLRVRVEGLPDSVGDFLRQERDNWKRSAIDAGVCSSCGGGMLREPCSDCLGTGWRDGVDLAERVKELEAEVERFKQEAADPSLTDCALNPGRSL